MPAIHLHAHTNDLTAFDDHRDDAVPEAQVHAACRKRVAESLGLTHPADGPSAVRRHRHADPSPLDGVLRHAGLVVDGVVREVRRQHPGGLERPDDTRAAEHVRLDQRVLPRLESQVGVIGVVGDRPGTTRHEAHRLRRVVIDTARTQRVVPRDPERAGRLRERPADRGCPLEDHRHCADLERAERRGRTGQAAPDDYEIYGLVPPHRARLQHARHRRCFLTHSSPTSRNRSTTVAKRLRHRAPAGKHGTPLREDHRAEVCRPGFAASRSPLASMGSPLLIAPAVIRSARPGGAARARCGRSPVGARSRPPTSRRPRRATGAARGPNP